MIGERYGSSMATTSQAMFDKQIEMRKTGRSNNGSPAKMYSRSGRKVAG